MVSASADQKSHARTLESNRDFGFSVAGQGFGNGGEVVLLFAHSKKKSKKK